MGIEEEEEERVTQLMIKLRDRNGVFGLLFDEICWFEFQIPNVYLILFFFSKKEKNF